jgi:tetratricopeptide (TPR) repeat protein
VRQLSEETYKLICKCFKNGAAKIHEGQFLQARNTFSAAIEALPNPKESCESYPWLLYGLAEAYYNECNYIEALAYFLKVLQLTQNRDINLHLRLALTHFKLGQKQEAAYHLELSKSSGDSQLSIADLEDPVYWRLIEGPIIDPQSMPPRSMK